MSKKKKQQEYKVGDIFCFQLNKDEYAFGRILLDVYNQCLKTGFIDKTSPLFFGRNGTLLIEVYKNTNNGKELPKGELEVLIPGIYTSDVALKLNMWEVLSNKKVDPLLIDFPESLSHNGAFKGHYIKGEIILEIPIEHRYIEELNIYSKELAPMAIPQITLCSLSREDELGLDEKVLKIKRIENLDLRFSKEKDHVRSFLPDEYKGNYYEMAKKAGFDLKRFYE